MSENSEHPVTPITWQENGVLLNLAQGYTFTLTLINCRNVRNQITKTTNIDGFDNQRPNCLVRWQPTSELSTLPLGLYSFVIRALNQRDNTEYVYKDTLMIEPA